MFNKLKQNIVKKGLFTLWVVLTSLYFVFGVYNYFKNEVYGVGVQYGQNVAINQVISEVVNAKCQKPIQLYSGQVSVNLVDISCFQASTSGSGSVAQ